jgi:hypothetical protein
VDSTPVPTTTTKVQRATEELQRMALSNIAKDGDFYRPPRTTSDYTITELRERKALTDSIANNLRVIGADSTDLSALGHRLENLTTALKLVREFSDSLDLEKLELRIASICTALKVIRDDEVVQELGTVR